MYAQSIIKNLFSIINIFLITYLLIDRKNNQEYRKKNWYSYVLCIGSIFLVRVMENGVSIHIVYNYITIVIIVMFIGHFLFQRNMKYCILIGSIFLSISLLGQLLSSIFLYPYSGNRVLAELPGIYQVVMMVIAESVIIAGCLTLKKIIERIPPHMEHLDMNLKIVKYILNQGYEDKKIGGAFYQRVQVRNSCGGYGKVMAIFPEGDIYMCQCMEQNQVRMGNILSDEPQKILQELENLLKKDEIKRLFCAEYKEICKECDYRYICGGHCLASEEPYDYRCIFLKAVLNYVLFYYDSKANRRKNLEIYIEYMEEVKRRWEEEPN